MLSSLVHWAEEQSFSEIMSALGGLAVIVGLLSWGWRFSKSMMLQRQFVRMALPGVYSGERDNNTTQGWLYEVLYLRSRGGKLRGRSIYVHRKDESYSLKVEKTRAHPNVLLGKWRSATDSYNYGDVLWNIDKDGRTLLTGCWSGTTRRGKVNFGYWRLVQCDPRDGQRAVKFLELKARTRIKRAISRLLASRDQKPALISEIIAKHDQVSEGFSYNGKAYRIGRGVFNPGLGKASTRLLELTLAGALNDGVMKILDWGTGCGFFAVELASAPGFQDKGGKVWAVENDERALACVRDNVSNFGLEKVITIVPSASPRELIENNRPIKFDLIIANLPFSLARADVVNRGHRMFKCFCMEPNFVLEMCVALRCHLGDGGRAMLAYGDSGDIEWLDTCLRIAQMTRREIEVVRAANHDVIYIFEIRREMGTYGI